jgi:magnesium transporter
MKRPKFTFRPPRLRKKQHPPVGARPGTLVVDAAAPPPRLRVIHFTAEGVDEADIAKPAELRDWMQRDGVTWIDVQGLGDEHVLRELGELFQIHPLALEGVVNAPQRPKSETFERHEFYITRMVRRRDAGPADVEQVSLFIGCNYVLLFQERYGDVLDVVRERIRQGKGPIRTAGADYLAYAIIDATIDGYFPVMEHVGDQLEALEIEAMTAATHETLQKINVIKRELMRLRRGLWPQRDALNGLVRDNSPFVTDQVVVYLRDCYDHVVQLGDMLEHYREMAGGLLNTYLSSVSNRTNEVMKVLTIMASIFIPLTFLAGIYGMNFQFMPELALPWAYPALLLVMALVTAAMVLYFRHLGWVGRPPDSAGDDAAAVRDDEADS